MLFSFKLHRVESRVLQRQLAWPGDSWRAAMASVSSGPCSSSLLPQWQSPAGAALPPEGTKPSSAGVSFSNTISSGFQGKWQCRNVCGVGHWDTSSDTQVAPGGFISLMRGLKAVTL